MRLSFLSRLVNNRSTAGSVRTAVTRRHLRKIEGPGYTLLYVLHVTIATHSVSVSVLSLSLSLSPSFSLPLSDAVQHASEETRPINVSRCLVLN